MDEAYGETGEVAEEGGGEESEGLVTLYCIKKPAGDLPHHRPARFLRYERLQGRVGDGERTVNPLLQPPRLLFPLPTTTGIVKIASFTLSACVRGI